VIYSAFTMPLNEGGFGLVILLEGFENSEEASNFLKNLMGPFEEDQWPQSDTKH